MKNNIHIENEYLDFLGLWSEDAKARREARKTKREEKAALKFKLMSQGLDRGEYLFLKNVGIQEIKAKKLETLKKHGGRKLWQKIKTATLAVPRNAFLVLMGFNVFNMATSFQELKDGGDPKYKELTNFWYKIGGNRTKLSNQIKRGHKKKPIFGADGEYLNTTGVDTAAAIATATPVLTKVGAILATIKSAAGTIGAVAGTAGSVAGTIKGISESTKNQPPSPYQALVDEASMEPDSEVPQFYLKPEMVTGLIILGVVGGGVAIYLATRKGKKSKKK